MAGKENVPPETKPSKKPRLSLSLQRKSKRFSSSTAKELEEMSKQKVPKNAEKSSKWAMTNMTEWLNDYNTRNTDAKCPDEFLTPSCSKENLCKWLCVFVNETRAKNGAPYPHKTLQCWSGSTALHSTCSSITSILQLLSIFHCATIISTSI